MTNSLGRIDANNAMWGWAGAYAGTVVLIAFTLIVRRPTMLSYPGFWAEDGTIFFREQTLLGFWAALAHPYQHFPYIAQRLLALGASPFKLKEAPLAYSVLSIGTVSLALGSFTLPHFRPIIRSDLARILFSLCIAALPQADEVDGVLANVHWYLAIWGVLIAITRPPRSRVVLTLVVAAWSLCLLSTPLLAITVPVWCGRAVLAFQRSLTHDLILSGCSVLTFLVVTAIAPGMGASGQSTFHASSLIELIGTRVISMSLVGSAATPQLLQSHGDCAIGLLAVAALTAEVVLLRLGAWRKLWLSSVCAYFIVASVFVTLIGRSGFPATIAQTTVAGRYFMLGEASVYLALIASIDAVRNTRARHAAHIIAGALILSVVSQSLAIAWVPPVRWSNYAPKLEHNLRSTRPVLLVIPTSPPGWAMVFRGRDPNVQQFPRPKQ